MSIEYIRKTYNLPKLKLGLSITYKGLKGVITYCTNYIVCRMEHDSQHHRKRFHPTDENLIIHYDSDESV